MQISRILLISFYVILPSLLTIHSVYSNDLENGGNKQGVSGLGVVNHYSYTNSPQVFAKVNSSKQKSILLVNEELKEEKKEARI